MANTFTSLHYHIVFSTKQREPWIVPQFQDRLWAYLGGIARQHQIKPLWIGGMPDHAHLLVGIPATLSVSEALKLLKGGSSIWAKDHLPGCKSFNWQDGYAAFTVSRSQVSEVEDSIRAQREHHRSRSFQEEYQALLDRHELAYEERYLWD
ncbi:MAG TPA: IS200/IS605 family transposase [Clostridia bacterium]|nr:IS200/IS605 family transposase [Clostridia bacterium]